MNSSGWDTPLLGGSGIRAHACNCIGCCPTCGTCRTDPRHSAVCAKVAAAKKDIADAYREAS